MLAWPLVDKDQPERCLRTRDETGQQDRRDEQQGCADHGPVAPAKARHRNRIRKPHQRRSAPAARRAERADRSYRENRPAAAWRRRCSRSARSKSRNARRRPTRSGCGGRFSCPAFPRIPGPRGASLRSSSCSVLASRAFLSRTMISAGPCRTGRVRDAEQAASPVPASFRQKLRCGAMGGARCVTDL